MLAVVACLGLLLGFAGCGEDKTKQQSYTGTMQLSETRTVPVELIMDEFGTVTLLSTNGDDLEIGGVYRQDGNNYVFESLDGKEIASATSTKNGIILKYRDLSVELAKNEKAVQTDRLYGLYKGYMYDNGPFEMRFVVRGDNNWYLIEEDGDLSDYGTYLLEGSLISAYSHEEPEDVYIFGMVEGETISLNIDGNRVDFQKIG